MNTQYQLATNQDLIDETGSALPVDQDKEMREQDGVKVRGNLDERVMTNQNGSQCLDKQATIEVIDIEDIRLIVKNGDEEKRKGKEQEDYGSELVNYSVTDKNSQNLKDQYEEKKQSAPGLNASVQDQKFKDAKSQKTGSAAERKHKSMGKTLNLLSKEKQKQYSKYEIQSQKVQSNGDLPNTSKSAISSHSKEINEQIESQKKKIQKLESEFFKEKEDMNREIIQNSNLSIKSFLNEEPHGKSTSGDNTGINHDNGNPKIELQSAEKNGANPDQKEDVNIEQDAEQNSIIDAYMLREKSSLIQDGQVTGRLATIIWSESQDSLVQAQKNAQNQIDSKTTKNFTKLIAEQQEQALLSLEQKAIIQQKTMLRIDLTKSQIGKKINGDVTQDQIQKRSLTKKIQKTFEQKEEEFEQKRKLKEELNKSKKSKAPVKINTTKEVNKNSKTRKNKNLDKDDDSEEEFYSTKNNFQDLDTDENTQSTAQNTSSFDPSMNPMVRRQLFNITKTNLPPIKEVGELQEFTSLNPDYQPDANPDEDEENPNLSMSYYDEIDMGYSDEEFDDSKAEYKNERPRFSDFENQIDSSSKQINQINPQTYDYEQHLKWKQQQKIQISKQQSQLQKEKIQLKNFKVDKREKKLQGKQNQKVVSLKNRTERIQAIVPRDIKNEAAQIIRKADEAKGLHSMAFSDRDFNLKFDAESMEILDKLRVYFTLDIKQQDSDSYLKTQKIDKQKALEAITEDKKALQEWLKTLIERQGQFTFITDIHMKEGLRVIKNPSEKYMTVDLKDYRTMAYQDLVRIEHYYLTYTDVFTKLTNDAMARDEQLETFKKQYQELNQVQLEKSTTKENWWNLVPENSAVYNKIKAIPVNPQMEQIEINNLYKNVSSGTSSVSKFQNVSDKREKQTFDEIILNTDIANTIEENKGKEIVSFSKVSLEQKSQSKPLKKLQTGEKLDADKRYCIGKHRFYQNHYLQVTIEPNLPVLTLSDAVQLIGPRVFTISQAELDLLDEESPYLENRLKEIHFIPEKTLYGYLMLAAHCFQENTDYFDTLQELFADQIQIRDENGFLMPKAKLEMHDNDWQLQMNLIRSYENIMKYVRDTQQTKQERFTKEVISDIFAQNNLLYVVVLHSVAHYLVGTGRTEVKFIPSSNSTTALIEENTSRYIDNNSSLETDKNVGVLVRQMMQEIVEIQMEMCLLQRYNLKLKESKKVTHNNLLMEYISHSIDKDTFWPSAAIKRRLYSIYRTQNANGRSVNQVWAKQIKLKKQYKDSKSNIATIEQTLLQTLEDNIKQNFKQIYKIEMELSQCKAEDIEGKAKCVRKIRYKIAEILDASQEIQAKTRIPADFSAKWISPAEVKLSDLEVEMPTKQREVFQDGCLWFQKVQTSLYGQQRWLASVKPEFCDQDFQKMTMRNLRDAYNSLKIACSSLKTIEALDIRYTKENVTAVYQKKPIQIADMLVAAVLQEIVAVQTIRGDAHIEDFEAIINNLTSELGEVKKQQAIKAAANRIKVIYMDLITIKQDKESIIYSPHFASQILHVSENYEQIQQETNTNIEAKFQYTSYIDSANIMQGTKKLIFYEKRDLEFQKVRKLLTGKKNNIKVGDIANRDKLAQITMENIIKQNKYQSETKPLVWKGEANLNQNVNYGFTQGEFKLEELVFMLTESVSETVIRGMIQTNTVKGSRQRNVGYNGAEQSTTYCSVISDKIYFHSSLLESVVGVKDDQNKPISKFKKWTKEVVLATKVLTELGINGLKVYLGRIGVCTKNLVSDIGCTNTSCTFLYEMLEYITLMLKDYCTKYQGSNVSETMEQYYVNAISKMEQNDYTYIGNAKTRRKIKQDLEKARAINMSTTQDEAPAWCRIFAHRDDIYGLNFDQIADDYSRSIQGQSNPASGDHMMMKLQLVVYSNFEFRDYLYNHDGLGWKKSTQNRDKSTPAQIEAEKKNIYEYILQGNMTRIMPALLFGFGLYSYELRDYMSQDWASNADQKTQTDKKTRELLCKLLIESMVFRYGDLAKSFRTIIAGNSTLHETVRNINSMDYGQLHSASLNVSTGKFGSIVTCKQ